MRGREREREGYGGRVREPASERGDRERVLLEEGGRARLCEEAKCTWSSELSSAASQARFPNLTYECIYRDLALEVMR